MSSSKTSCPDCGTELQPIKLVDATDKVLGDGMSRVELRYAAQDARPLLGGLIGGIQPEGRVYGRLCGRCGRILLYAVPMET